MRSDTSDFKSTMDKNILSITPHNSDDGSVEPNRYSVDLNKSLLPLGSLLLNVNVKI